MSIVAVVLVAVVLGLWVIPSTLVLVAASLLSGRRRRAAPSTAAEGGAAGAVDELILDIRRYLDSVR